MEAVSNPIAPEIFTTQDDLRSQKLSNSDFRKLLMTPKPSLSHPIKDDSVDVGLHNNTTVRPSDRTDRNQEDAQRNKQKQPHKRPQTKHKRDNQKSDPNESVQRYRDRAKERRASKLSVPVEEAGDDREPDDEDNLNRTADYRAVAPSLAVGTSHAERRRMIIQESKYLGGDMEHTHLVKGLDYVLLQKVRLEIENKELEAEQVLDAELIKLEKVKDITSEESIQFHTRIGANICDVLFNRKPLERNEYFQPGRMAYRIELEDDSVDFEVPATVIRSKSDCMQVADGRVTGVITTNEIVINKLTQILSYLRAGKRHAKKNKTKGRGGDRLEADNSSSKHIDPRLSKSEKADIFEGVGSDYVPSSNNSRNHRHHGSSTESIRDGSDKKSRHATNDQDSESQRTKTYFDDDSAHAIDAASGTGCSVNATKEFMNELSQRFGMKDDNKVQDKESLERFFAKTRVTCYDECYPGFAESFDEDSDDEADFSKMDTGNKKGPVGRWDFETQEEYSDYMSNREAMPRAAFQYGLKMADGRRTRRVGPKDEKVHLDRQLQKIQSIIQKRKIIGETGGPVGKYPRF